MGEIRNTDGIAMTVRMHTVEDCIVIEPLDTDEYADGPRLDVDLDNAASLCRVLAAECGLEVVDEPFHYVCGHACVDCEPISNGRPRCVTCIHSGSAIASICRFQPAPATPSESTDAPEVSKYPAHVWFPGTCRGLHLCGNCLFGKDRHYTDEPCPGCHQSDSDKSDCFWQQSTDAPAKADGEIDTPQCKVCGGEVDAIHPLQRICDNCYLLGLKPAAQSAAAQPPPEPALKCGRCPRCTVCHACCLTGLTCGHDKEHVRPLDPCRFPAIAAAILAERSE